MKVLVIYCHPSNNSFTYEVKNEFIRGLHDGNHEYTLLDLYALDFKETFSESEYLREAFYNEKIDILDDVKEFQKLINQNNALVFIYPRLNPAEQIGPNIVLSPYTSEDEPRSAYHVGNSPW